MGHEDRNTYTIGETARITGISEHVLRSWQKRYGLVVTAQTKRGHRRFSVAEVRRLQIVRKLVDAGKPPGDALALKGRCLWQAYRNLSEPSFNEISGQIESRIIREWILASLIWNPNHLVHRFEKEWTLLGAIGFAELRLRPLFRAIDSCWTADLISVKASESVYQTAEDFLRSKILKLTPKKPTGSVVITTLTSGSHRLATLLLACISAIAGYRPILAFEAKEGLQLKALMDAINNQQPAKIIVSIPHLKPQLIEILKKPFFKTLSVKKIIIGGDLEKGALPSELQRSYAKNLETFYERLRLDP